MEWNNPRHNHAEWNNEWRYLPQKVIGADGRTIPIIWADSIAFQKFQRYAHGEYNLDEYYKYLRSKIGKNERYFPIYSNDAEIFNFRPSRYRTEAQIGNSGEWKHIRDLFKNLKNCEEFNFVLPSDVLKGLNHLNGGNSIKLESPQQPIPVKKQEK